MGKKLTRKRVLQYIADASLFGQLGLFVGAGFSMALTNQKAPSFGELLQRVAERLELDFDFDDLDNFRGRDFPRIAAQLVDLLEKGASSRKSAEVKFKREIAKICTLAPDEALLAAFRPVVTGLKPSWIITTNYDFILEMLFEEAISLLPNEAVLPRHDQVPIYHLHGHRLIPESIIVTTDDYVDLLGTPMEYRQHKLSLLLTESTTLMLGYRGGDMNVLTAMKHARSFAEDRDLQLQKYEGRVV
jgi:hypothetical protein